MGNILNSSLTKTLTEMGSGMVQTIREAKITETIESGVQSVKSKLTDPKLQEDIRETVQTGRNRLFGVINHGQDGLGFLEQLHLFGMWQKIQPTRLQRNSWNLRHHLRMQQQMGQFLRVRVVVIFCRNCG